MLILGSYGFSYPAARNKLEKLTAGKHGKMLIIPLACSQEKEVGEYERDCAALSGFNKDKILVFDKNDPEKYTNENYAYITVLGGNTFKLLYSVKKYGLDSFIRQQVKNGAVYLGFSAGAYLACDNIEYVKLFDDKNHITNGDFKALGLTDKYVLCHYDFRGPAEIKMCRSFIGDETELITINNDEFVVLEQSANTPHDK